MWGCDHGVSFHVDDKLRTVLWGWADEPLRDVGPRPLDAARRLHLTRSSLSATWRRCSRRCGDRRACTARARVLRTGGRMPAPGAVVARHPVAARSETVGRLRWLAHARVEAPAGVSVAAARPGSATPPCSSLYDARTGRVEQDRPRRRGAACTSAASRRTTPPTSGHAATYVAFDLAVRAWREAGHRVRYVQNVTDVDDPLLERAAQTGEDWRELAERETQLFRDDMAALSVIPPDAYVGAVESIAPGGGPDRAAAEAGRGVRASTATSTSPSTADPTLRRGVRADS